MDEEADTVLSDVEGEEPIPNVLDGEVSVERFREILLELDRERALREAAEASKLEIQASFHKIKALAHEAIKKRDQAIKERDDTVRERDEALRERDDALRLGSELIEVQKRLEDMVGERDSLRSEIEKSRHMLVSGIDRISGKVSHFKDFETTGGLPRSQKYSGLPATAYGVIKRTNEIVEEMLRQVDALSKAKNEVRERMDHRNYEIAIEVSQLEASISGLRDEVAKKDRMLGIMEQEAAERTRLVEEEGQKLNDQIREYDAKIVSLQSKMESQTALLIDQLSLIGKIHDRLYDVIKILDSNHSDSELSESLFLPQKMSMEENARASLAGMESIYELTRVVFEKIRDVLEERSREISSLRETVSQSTKEKEHIGILLRSALSKKLNTNEKNELLLAADSNWRNDRSNVKPDKVSRHNGPDGAIIGEDEIFSLAGALEQIVKASQMEIMELRHSVEEARAESLLLKEKNDAQAKELANKLRRLQELEEKERVANENIEGLMMDIATLEEEIQRWKVAAEQEAAAGGAVEQEFAAQLSSVKRELEEARQALLESEKKLKFKEETAIAAMAARETAERSLALADTRASRLRERLEVLNRQLEELETHRETSARSGHRYVCWPWQWLGMDFVGTNTVQSHESQSNEMELSEPLI